MSISVLVIGEKKSSFGGALKFIYLSLYKKTLVYSSLTIVIKIII